MPQWSLLCSSAVSSMERLSLEGCRVLGEERLVGRLLPPEVAGFGGILSGLLVPMYRRLPKRSSSVVFCTSDFSRGLILFASLG